jgi:hypothetical protein
MSTPWLPYRAYLLPLRPDTLCNLLSGNKSVLVQQLAKSRVVSKESGTEVGGELGSGCFGHDGLICADMDLLESRDGSLLLGDNLVLVVSSPFQIFNRLPTFCYGVFVHVALMCGRTKLILQNSILFLEQQDLSFVVSVLLPQFIVNVA